MTDQQQPGFASWCLVEQLGHRRLIAYVTEHTIAGRGFLRLDEPAVDDIPARTQYASPDSIYALHPMTEDAANAYAARMRTAPPLAMWDLPDNVRQAVRALDAGAVNTPDDPGPPDEVDPEREEQFRDQWDHLDRP